jgi:hypothetical protein
VKGDSGGAEELPVGTPCGESCWACHEDSVQSTVAIPGEVKRRTKRDSSTRERERVEASRIGRVLIGSSQGGNLRQKRVLQKNSSFSPPITTQNTTTQFHNGRCADCQSDPALPASGLECRQGLQACRCSVRCHPAEPGACRPALPGSRSSQASPPHLL